LQQPSLSLNQSFQPLRLSLSWSLSQEPELVLTEFEAEMVVEEPVVARRPRERAGESSAWKAKSGAMGGPLSPGRAGTAE
jgi:hypothetical protein